MEPILDTDLFHKYCDTLDLARSQAMLESANTGGAVLAVRSVEINHEALLFIGPISAIALNATTDHQQRRPIVRCRSLGNFHTTWAALLGAPEPAIGFLVLHHPLTLRCARADSDRDEIWIAVEVNRGACSLALGPIGPRCCCLCNEPISKPRLIAVPGVRICTKCQTIKEEMKS